MNKNDIEKALQNLELDKEKYIIISGASLVLQDIITETPDIDLATTKEYYDKIQWEEEIGAFNTNIKKNGCFEIGVHLYFLNETIEYKGYKIATLSHVLRTKKALNREKDKEIIKRIEKLITLS